MKIKNRAETPTITLAQMKLLFRLRILWREMVTWIREYLISRFIFGDYYQDAFTRLYNVPVEFGNLLMLVFGEEIGNQYQQLLSDQIIVLRDYIEALISGDINSVNENSRELYQGGDTRARFLASINPFWSQEQLRSLVNTFLTLNAEEIEAFLTGNYELSITIFDMLLSHSDLMGDYFMTGLYNYITYQNTIPEPIQSTPIPPTSTNR